MAIIHESRIKDHPVQNLPVNRALSGYAFGSRKVGNKDGLTANLPYYYPAFQAPLLKQKGS